MTAIENVKETGTTVFMDGKHFINCKYVKCTLIYAGGDCGWTNTSFTDCKLKFSGAADRTVNMLRSFNMIPGMRKQVPPMSPPSSKSLN